jgi:voltage-gated potassium channel Kch
LNLQALQGPAYIEKARDAGADEVVSPSALAGIRMAARALGQKTDPDG